MLPSSLPPVHLGAKTVYLEPHLVDQCGKRRLVALPLDENINVEAVPTGRA